MARDKTKDQSYFLYNLTQKQLAHILFPVGDYRKKEVVAMAKKWQLPVAHRPESQEICFLPENDYRPFLKRHISSKIIPGDVVDIKGLIIGQHQGLPLYTIGQRHGFEIRTKNIEHRTKGVILPFYVIGKNVKRNQLIVGFGQETELREFFVKDVSWINPNYPLIINHQPLFLRIRHQGNLLKARVEIEKKQAKVILNEPERGVAPGQAAVFYSPVEASAKAGSGEEVLGGGIIHLDNY
jgi:tRNA-specific 2-thiouridylase